MKRNLLILLAVTNLLLADSNINNSGTFNNYGSITNNQVNNNDLEKANFDLKIAKLANKIISSPNKKNQLAVIVESAKKANSYNISKEHKLEKCIEYALSIKIFKIDFKLAKNECNKIFK